jgi:hypothetical protein
MPTRIEYSQEKELDDALAKVLADTPELANVVNHCKVAACFVMRQNDQEEQVPGKGDKIALKKVSPATQVFMRPKADFILVVDYYFWTNATEKEKKGKLIRTLTRIGIENTNNGIKLSIRPWDIQENVAAIKACGVFDEMGSRAKEAFDRCRVTIATTEAMLANQAKAAAVKDEPKAESKAKGKKDDDDEPPLRPARKPPVESKRPDPEPEPE